MSYQAIITPITNIRPHSNADRLVLGTAAGHQVIVSKSTTEGTLGIFFPSDGQLSVDMCRKNNLYSHKELNTDQKKAGFFGNNRRVRAQRFRGEISEGFWVELEYLEWTGMDVSSLKEGALIDELNGMLICNKYFTPATQRAINQSKGKGKNSKKGFRPDSFPHFKEHWHTNKLRMMIGTIPEGAILSISEKCHGTSARTGHLQQITEPNWFIKMFTWRNKEEWKYVSGTRKVVLDPKKTEDAGFYSGKKFRSIIHQGIKSIGLAKGETIYYEIVGYDDGGGLIMGTHNIEDKELLKRYGNCIAYTYGCKSGEFKILVYRMTQTSPDGYCIELPLTQLKHRCSILGLDLVPQLQEPFIYDGNKEKLLELCERLSQGCSALDEDHIREGVVVRAEAPGLDNHYKYKGWNFCSLENIAKNTDEYVDLEEVS